MFQNNVKIIMEGSRPRQRIKNSGAFALVMTPQQLGEEKCRQLDWLDPVVWIEGIQILCMSLS